MPRRPNYESDESGIWTRREHESSQAFHAFCLYRDAGPRRSKVGVTNTLAGRDHDSEKRHKSGIVQQWAVKYDWANRAKAWDDYLDLHARRRQLEIVERMVEQHAKIASQALGVLMMPLVELSHARQDIHRNDLAKMKASELLAASIASLRLVPILQEAERKARGLDANGKATDNTPVEAIEYRWVETSDSIEEPDPPARKMLIDASPVSSNEDDQVTHHVN